MGAQIASANLVSPLRLDVGISSDGPDHDPFAKALCVGRWDEFDHDYRRGSPEALTLAEFCGNCPVLDACQKRTEDSDRRFGAHGFAAGKTAIERSGLIASERVQRVLDLVGTGMSDADVADEVGISRRTVADYRNIHGVRPNGDKRGGARGRSQIARV